MINPSFLKRIKADLRQLDDNHVSKSDEHVISSVQSAVKATVDGQVSTLFNSNDYLGLRLNKDIIEAEHEAALEFGSSPGAVRFISGTLADHKELEARLSKFHGREDTILFSSAFMANLAVMTALISYQKGAEEKDCLVISDELNHRSIIDGIRLSSTPDKAVYRHLDYQHLAEILKENVKSYRRVVVVTDGVFSMLGETADLSKIRLVIDQVSDSYEEGVLFVVDDCHGIGVIGQTGRGCEEYYGAKSDLLVGTLGKALGCEGGYVTGPKVLIRLLREKAASYIFTAPISPASAAGGITAIDILDSPTGKVLLSRLNQNIKLFKTLAKKYELSIAIDSNHPIQPLLIKNSLRAIQVADELIKNRHIFATPITYPAVARGKEEIRIQISAAHNQQDIEKLAADLNSILEG